MCSHWHWAPEGGRAERGFEKQMLWGKTYMTADAEDFKKHNLLRFFSAPTVYFIELHFDK